MFTVVSYNIEAGVGVTKGYGGYFRYGWKHFLPHISEKINLIGKFFDEHKVDIAIISEIDEISIKTRGTSQAKILSEHSKLHHFKFFPTFLFQPFFYGGNAILSRYPIIAAETIKLPGGRWSRYVNKATILVEGKEIEVFVTHLSLGKKNRTKQIEAITKMLSTVTQPAIIGGDFNCAADGEMMPFKAVSFETGDTQLSYPSWKPKKKLDYLMANKGIAITNGFVASQALFSDHLPVFAECELTTDLTPDS